jgi:hypothetical protein
VITVESNLARLGDKSGVKYLGKEVDWYITNSIVIWHPETGKLEHKYYLDDYFNPTKNPVKGEPNSMTWTYNVSCSEENQKISSALEWSHMSSISEGPDDYIVALRNLDTVIAFAKDGSGVSWTLSSEAQMNSNFTFARCAPDLRRLRSLATRASRAGARAAHSSRQSTHLTALTVLPVAGPRTAFTTRTTPRWWVPISMRFF